MAINKRSELLFLYDCSYNNPNGDPNNENKPRIDEETGINLVTDVRLKRTIRDYLYEIMKEEILVREITEDDGTIQNGITRASDFLENKKLKKLEAKKEIEKNVLEQCIDVRLFGCTLPLSNASVTFTGPVQFKIGQSLHRVQMMFLKGTGAFASQKGKSKKTFREEYVLPYSLIAFYGIINENAAKYTWLEENDIQKMLWAMWNGTRDLTSRSKMGQQPRLLLRIVYKEGELFHLGELEKYLDYDTQGVNEEAIREIESLNLNFDKLISELKKIKNRIDHVEIHQDINGAPDLAALLEKAGFEVQKLPETIDALNQTLENI